jgi:hypothetical protein
MIVLVETNFILEIAFLQKQQEDCFAILHLAEAKKIDLVLPAFSVAEPYYTLEKRKKGRKNLQNSLNTEINEISRSVSYQDLPELRKATNLLVQSANEDQQRLNEGWDRILNIAKLIPINLDIMRAAIKYQDALDFKDKTHDSVVYASVIYHLNNNLSNSNCFITLNKHDFDIDVIKTELAMYNCKILYSFKDAVAYIKSCV